MQKSIYIGSFLLLFFLSNSIGICQLNEIHRTIQGQVTDKQNNPLSDYVVSVVTQTKVTYADKTGSTGKFTLSNLPIGTYNLTVQHFSTFVTQRKITVPKTSFEDIDIEIEGTGTITGFLLDSQKNLPLLITGDIQIALLKDEWIDRIYNGKVANGYFKFNNLLSGQYTVIDAFDGYVFTKSDSPLLTVYPGSHVGDVKVELKQGATVSGRFIDANNGNPISNVFVSIASEKSKSVYPDGSFLHEKESDNNGSFQLTIPNDPDIYNAFTLIASHPRYQTNRWRWDMSPGKKSYVLGELNLKQFLSLQGKVSSSSAKYTVAGLTVQLKMHNKSANFFRAAAQPEHTVHTDTQGNFQFSELHPIEYSLTITRNDVIIVYIESVNPQNSEFLNVRLQKLKTLHGTVVDELQRPITDAKIYAILNNENPHAHGAILAMTQSNKNGAYQMQLIDTKPHLLSLDVSKNGYLSRIYPNIKITSEPLIVPLQKGFSIKGRVVLPQNIPIDGYYEVKVFPENAEMQSTLNPLTLYRPLLSRRFPVTETSFALDGLFEEKYKLYITGNGIAATQIDAKAVSNGEELFIIADETTGEIKGQVIWEDTEEPIQDVLIVRSWYPWELSQYDMSLTLDRFETESDDEGIFTFSNLSQRPYQLHLRAIQLILDKETGKYQRTHIQKEVLIPACSENIHHIYLGREDGTPFSKTSENYYRKLSN